MNATRGSVALATAIGAWAFALAARAQDVFAGDDARVPGDWMASGLAPLVLLLALGILVALVAAGVAAMMIGVSRRRFGGPRAA